MMRGASFCLLLLWVAAVLGCSRASNGTHGAVQRNPELRPSGHAPPASAGNDGVPDTRVEPSAPSAVPALRAGVYRLTLLAEQGSRQGASSEGSLTLVPASAADESPITGEAVKDLYELPRFYGWTALDFPRVAAPMCRNPDPASRDPVRPGALVLARTPLGHQVVLIGTVSNLRDGSSLLDGCGIALHVERWKDNCYLGTWDRWGIVADGSGTFRACSVASLDGGK